MTVPPMRQTALIGSIRGTWLSGPGGFRRSRLRELRRDAEKLGRRRLSLFMLLLIFQEVSVSDSSVMLREIVLGNQYPSFPRGMLRPWTTCLWLLLGIGCVTSCRGRV